MKSIGLLRRSGLGRRGRCAAELARHGRQVRMHRRRPDSICPGLRVMSEVKPDEVYNLAAQSFVKTSWTAAAADRRSHGAGRRRMLEAVRLECARGALLPGHSSEMYGLVQEPVQSETTPFYPRVALRASPSCTATGSR